MHNEYKRNSNRLSHLAVAAITIMAIASVLGNLYTYDLLSRSIADFETRVATLQTRISALTDTLEGGNQTSLGNISLSELYAKVRDSVVLIHGYVSEIVGGFQQFSEVSGSGFVYNLSNRMVVNTNYHVVQDAVGLTATFRNGSSYSAAILGSDPYVDFAVLSVEAPIEEFKPLPIVSSSLVNVGDLVIAVGNPYGLTGTMTTGIVSQVGRTITEPMTGGYPIAGVIQISTPINPGNSGGPLLNSKGQVVGITTAIITESQGLGFAIPSDIILREIDTLGKGMEYEHSWIGVTGMDMTYEISRAMDTTYTYGWLVVSVIDDSPASMAGLRGSPHEVEIYGQTIRIGGDIILEIDDTRIISGDDISSYLEEYTSPGQTINMTVERGNGNRYTEVLSLVLGRRPSPV